MSDIGLNLSGVIALFVFLLAAGLLAIGGLISLIIAAVRASKSGRKTRQQGAFAFFIGALPLIVVNVIAFGILIYFVDSNERETNEFLDKVAAYVWLPLQVIVWIVSGIILKRVRK